MSFDYNSFDNDTSNMGTHLSRNAWIVIVGWSNQTPSSTGTKRLEHRVAVVVSDKDRCPTVSLARHHASDLVRTENHILFGPPLPPDSPTLLKQLR